MNAMRRLFIWIIKAYQIIFAGAPKTCRFQPSCSEYAIKALERYGVVRGSGMAIWRVLRCNPWNPGGYDPVR